MGIVAGAGTTTMVAEPGTGCAGIGIGLGIGAGPPLYPAGLSGIGEETVHAQFVSGSYSS